jgi:multiple sugar transport system substrate-binding protein
MGLETPGVAAGERVTRRRMVWLAPVLAAGSGVLAACAQGQSQPPAQAVLDKETRREIAFWPRNATDKIAFDNILPLAKQRFPNLTVNMEVPAGNLLDKLKVSLAADTPPDAVVISLTWTRFMVQQKAILSLQEYVKRDRDVADNLKQFAPAAVGAYTFEDKLYALPTTNEGIVLWYNKDAFSEAKLPFPRDIEDDPAKWNWNSVVEMARALNRGSGTGRQRYGVMVTGRKTNAAISESWGNLVYANEARFLNDAGTRWVLNSREGLQTIEWIVDLQKRYGVHPEVEHYLEQNVLDRTIFQEGRLGMLIQGEFLSRYLYGNQKPAGGIPFQFDIAQLPFAPGKKKRASVFNGTAAGMIRGTKQPDGVWQWFHALSFKEAQQQITNHWGSRGAHQGTYETWLRDGGGGGPAGLNYQAIVKASNTAISYPVSPYLNQDDLVNPCTDVLFGKVFTLKQLPSEGLREMETEINARLQSAGAPATR